MNNSINPTDNRQHKIYSVSDLTEKIKVLLENSFDFIWVEAEISNFRSPSSGHYYMVLKDEESQIRAVMFRPQVRYLKFRPEDGMKVLAQGRISVYQPRGEYQIILDYLEPLGVGALALAFEQLKKKLASQGLFDTDIKKPLPFLPQKITVITSPTGAAVRDFLKVTFRRFANMEITIIPVKVQGDDAASEMINAIEIANTKLESDVIVLTRGGGSMEDLWAFNNEELAYTIRASNIPIVSAVGHEIDYTISDLVSDFRAPTPSAAAEILVAEKENLKERISDKRDRLYNAVKTSITYINNELSLLLKGLRDPKRMIADSWMHLDELNNQLVRLVNLYLKETMRRLASEGRALLSYSPSNMMESLGQRIQFQKQSLLNIMFRTLKENQMELSLFEEKIKDLSPLSVLKRGYSVTRMLPEKVILKNTSGLKLGDKVNILLAEGDMDCRVEKIVK